MDVDFEKFEAMCKEFGGVPNRGVSKVTLNGLLPMKEESPVFDVCVIEDYDDFKGFIQWMHRNDYKFKGLRGWVEAHYSDYNGFGEFTAEFYSDSNFKPMAKKLILIKKENLGDVESLNETFREELGAEEYEYGGPDNLFLTEQERYDIEEKVTPSLRQYASADVVFDENNDTWYARSEINFIVEKDVKLSALLKDAEDTLDSLSGWTEDVFGKKLFAIIDRLRGQQHH